jgi:HlyD family secretion protein
VNPSSFRSRLVRPLAIGALLLAVVVVFLVVRARGRHSAAMDVQTEAVARRDISQTVEATGTLEPIEIVEIKSKASGQILRMPVEIGSVVRAGDLLAQIDTVNVQNTYDEAYAALKAAQANLDITRAQVKRADELYKREVITTDQHESATLGYANAQSTLVRARSDLSTARQALGDATVRAPSDGTVIEQDVTRGQVIASATMSASGGTTLLKMADLNRVQMQALVGETDIGNVRAGMPASVTVDAFPNRPFQGVVLKIEPQATVQQSVTMFPVLVSIANENGLLLPGMNGEVTIAISQRAGVLAVPIDAVRTARELPAVAATLGLDPDSLRAQVQRQVAASLAAHRGFGADSGRRGDRSGSSDSAGRRPGAGARNGGARPPWMSRGGTGGNPQDRAAWMARRFGGAGGGRGGSRGDSTRGGFGGGAGGGAGGGTRATQAQVVLLQTPQGLVPRVVRLGISDFDYTEILDGLKEGDQVALLSVAEVQAKRQSDQQQMRQRMGSGVPGVPGGTGARGGGGAGGGGRGGR